MRYNEKKQRPLLNNINNDNVGYESHNVLISLLYVNILHTTPQGDAYCKGMLIGTGGARIEEVTLNKNGVACWNEVCTSQ